MLAIILTIKGHFTTRFSACVRPDGDSDGDSKDAAKSVGFYYLITALRARLASTGRKYRAQVQGASNGSAKVALTAYSV